VSAEIHSGEENVFFLQSEEFRFPICVGSEPEISVPAR